KLTVMGSTVGTPTYMSPEQAAGDRVDAQTDLYALGVILYEMANGKPPFTGKNAVKTMRSHLFDPIPTFSNAKLRNTRFESMCMKALQKDRGDRFSSATEFLACLEEDLSVRTIGTIVLPGKENFDEDAPTIELVDTELGGAASSDAVSMPDTGDPVDAVLASIPLFSAKHKKANPRDAVPFSGTHDAPRESVREGASTSNLTESSDLGRALDPPRFDENPPPASISSSILTVVEEGPGEEEEEVILLTRPKRGHATPVPQEFDPDPLEESQERMMEKDRSAEWVWGEASIKVDESLERSQELQARSGAQVALPVVLLVLVLAILAGAGAWWAGWLPF
ncbi:MAG: serine/threonine protein kinase, partial [Bradymonadaceae bacterium]